MPRYNYCPECVVNTVDFAGKCVLCKAVYTELAQPENLQKLQDENESNSKKEVKTFKKIEKGLASSVESNYILKRQSQTDPQPKENPMSSKPLKIKTPLSRASEKGEVKPLVKSLTEKKPAEKKLTERKPTATGTLIKMLLEKKHTDDYILETVNKQFNKKFNQSFISTCRTRLNKEEDYMMNAFAAAGGRSKVLPIERIESKK